MNRFIPKLPDKPCLSVVPVDQSSPNAYLKDFLILLYVNTYIHTYIQTKIKTYILYLVKLDGRRWQRMLM